jgi:uncharacterized protein YfiM (DUF2279 family)
MLSMEGIKDRETLGPFNFHQRTLVATETLGWDNRKENGSSVRVDFFFEAAGTARGQVAWVNGVSSCSNFDLETKVGF